MKVWWRQVVTTPDPSPEARNVSSNLFLSHPTSLHQNIKVTIGTINGRHYHYPKKENVWVQQTSFCLQQVIGVDQEKWPGIKNFVGSGKPANGNYVWTTAHGMPIYLQRQLGSRLCFKTLSKRMLLATDISYKGTTQSYSVWYVQHYLCHRHHHQHQHHHGCRDTIIIMVQAPCLDFNNGILSLWTNGEKPLKTMVAWPQKHSIHWISIKSNGDGAFEPLKVCK